MRPEAQQHVGRKEVLVGSGQRDLVTVGVSECILGMEVSRTASDLSH